MHTSLAEGFPLLSLLNLPIPSGKAALTRSLPGGCIAGDFTFRSALKFGGQGGTPHFVGIPGCV
jgi:hypothetical protein